MPTNSQGVPWNTGYIVASGNLLTDFRSNAAAEGQSRLMSSRIANMTDDRGVKDMLASTSPATPTTSSSGSSGSSSCRRTVSPTE